MGNVGIFINMGNASGEIEEKAEGLLNLSLFDINTLKNVKWKITFQFSGGTSNAFKYVQRKWND